MDVLVDRHASGRLPDLNLDLGDVARAAISSEHLMLVSDGPGEGYLVPLATEAANTPGVRTAINILDWCHQRGWVPTTDHMEEAAVQGHVPALAWLRAHGCPWRERVCEFAMMLDDPLPVIKWLRAHGCPWDERVCEWVGNHNRGGEWLPVLAWLTANGCPCGGRLHQL